jgi:hypothetical protein
MDSLADITCSTLTSPLHKNPNKTISDTFVKLSRCACSHVRFSGTEDEDMIAINVTKSD